jgi:regulatory protein
MERDSGPSRVPGGRGTDEESTGHGQEPPAARSRTDDPERQARDHVYRLLATRARSHSELRRALLRKGIGDDVAEAVLQKFRNAGLVDDAAFAETWVQQRQRQQGLGKDALGHELRSKGLDEEVIADALSTVDSDDEVERAHELVRSRLRTMPSVDGKTRMRRLVAMLGRKGYSEALAFRVARKELEQSDVDDLEGEVAHFD